jgi:hypothetical protein
MTKKKQSLPQEHTTPDTVDPAANEPRKQRRWANRIHSGDNVRAARGRGKPKPGPAKRGSGR